MILSHEQACAVYRAMTELNNVSGLLYARLLSPGMTVHVQEYLTDEVAVWSGGRPGNPVGGAERYANQREFAAAYKLGPAP